MARGADRPDRRVRLQVDDLALSAWRPGPIPHTVFHQPCLDFVNSEFTDHRGSGVRYDRLPMLGWRRWFLDRWTLNAPLHPTSADTKRLDRLRSLIRGLLESGAAPTDAQLRSLNQVLEANPSVWRLGRVASSDSDTTLSMKLLPLERGWTDVMAAVVASYAELTVSGDLRRVKRCGNPSCQFIFFDSSANQTRRWCDPALCGNLVKVRAFRARDKNDARV
jgi:predicted RNA-binding Zn ribbon-like protein